MLPGARSWPRAVVRLAVVGAAVLALASCAADGQVTISPAPGGAEQGPTSTPTGGNGSNSTTVPGTGGRSPAEAAPVVGQCRGPLTSSILDAPSDPRPAVPCSGTHGTETFYVGTMDSSIPTWPGDDTDGALSREVDEACTARHLEYVGLTAAREDTLPPDRVQDFAYFIPTESDFAAGARWFRCDAVVQPVASGEATTVDGTLRSVYAKPLPVGYRLCEGTLNRLAACNEKHQIEYLASVQLPDVSDYPAQRGDATVTQACRAPLLAALGLTTERADLAFGYVLPSEDVWDAGLRSATCVAGAADNAPLDDTLYQIGPTRPLPLAG
jgi:Septum formation